VRRIERLLDEIAPDRTTAATLQLDAALGLNRYRAFVATPGCEAAEAFVVAPLSSYRVLTTRA
jgi:hypothetical protein